MSTPSLFDRPKFWQGFAIRVTRTDGTTHTHGDDGGMWPNLHESRDVAEMVLPGVLQSDGVASAVVVPIEITEAA